MQQQYQSCMKTGDILLTKGLTSTSQKVVFSQLITQIAARIPLISSRLEKYKETNILSNFSHVAICVEPGIFIEAIRAGVKFITFKELFIEPRMKSHWKVYRPKLTFTHKELLLKSVYYYIDQDYSFNLRHVIFILSGKIYDDYDRSFCSELAVKIIRNDAAILPIDLHKEAKEIAPITFQNFMENNDIEDITDSYKDCTGSYSKTLQDIDTTSIVQLNLTHHTLYINSLKELLLSLLEYAYNDSMHIHDNRIHYLLKEKLSSIDDTTGKNKLHDTRNIIYSLEKLYKIILRQDYILSNQPLFYILFLDQYIGQETGFENPGNHAITFLIERKYREIYQRLKFDNNSNTGLKFPLKSNNTPSIKIGELKKSFRDIELSKTIKISIDTIKNELDNFNRHHSPVKIIEENNILYLEDKLIPNLKDGINTSIISYCFETNNFDLYCPFLDYIAEIHFFDEKSLKKLIDDWL